MGLCLARRLLGETFQWTFQYISIHLGYLVGQFPSGNGEARWAEWNGKFRDTVRGFIKGDPAMKGQFATRVCGSPDLYEPDGRGPCHSINFITAHDGFTLRSWE